ncbi:DsbE family thiol:disulfide interchange protein [Comamonas sp. NLF-1-9]|uniref:DsbE family thiol:disulfide interchange protein n=1 Tax=Comamonas sp. NLF-1-9 TaxID=2853163 RepID=UPI001C4611A0|nr:DsbE family thiol:disulfide interchange protein [Comamonas sp. NLF-1-9]QXL84305.1 DsbE family thiol:disulfide interchange protein [Comamonas sp. NLF-1-9]
MRKGIVPLAVFAVLMVFLGIGLTLKPRELPSPLIDKPLPAFTLPQLGDPAKTASAKDMAGKVWMLNVWASWCVACRVEHPVFVDLARSDKSILIYGLNYKDKREDALRWLARLGNPYLESFSDTQGLVGIDLGVYGVPETFIIDRQGVIRYKHIGPVTPEALQETILPLMRKLGA